jgi:hypothetical protein
VEGPTNESASTIDGSEGGVGQVCSPTVKLANINRWAPAFDFFRPKSEVSRSGADCVLVGTTAIDDFLDSGIKPWVARLGVGGNVCLLTRFGSWMVVAAESLKLLS